MFNYDKKVFMGLFGKKKNKDSKIDQLVADIYGESTKDEDYRTAVLFKEFGFTQDQTSPILKYLHGQSECPDIDITDDQIKEVVWHNAGQLKVMYDAMKNMCPEYSPRAELLRFFAAISAASTEVNPIFIQAFNIITSSDNRPVSYDSMIETIREMNLIELITDKMYSGTTDAHMKVFFRTCSSSYYVNNILLIKNQNIIKECLCFFSMLLVGIGSFMKSGATTRLLYTVLNNSLVEYFEIIELNAKGAIPQEAYACLRLINQQMKDLNG